jgi:hypothetical protein
MSGLLIDAAFTRSTYSAGNSPVSVNIVEWSEIFRLSGSEVSAELRSAKQTSERRKLLGPCERKKCAQNFVGKEEGARMIKIKK